MKRAFLVHGWQGRPEDGWRPWLKKELEKNGFKVFVPEMPDTDHPKMEAWIETLKEVVGTPGKECYFVGHSLGCIAILRYFEMIENEVGGAVLVAGFSEDLGIKELESFFARPVGWEKIKSVCRKFVAIHSDNDPYVSLRYGHEFENKLDARLVIEHGMKHFSGDDGVFRLPSALEAVLEIS